MDIAHCYLDGNVDAVEFCPHEHFHHVLAAATYTLQEGNNPSRSGSISLFSVDAQTNSLEPFHRINTSGIFDIKWSPIEVNGSPLLAQADADGYLRIHSLETSSIHAKIGDSSLIEFGEEKVSSSMCLCLDWSPSATSISVALSDGSVSIINLCEAKLNIQQTWNAHKFEIWATSFDPHQPELVYTGSDDCRFCCWDLREGLSKLAFQNSKIHTMGVCCISKSPSDPNKLLTGSYDEYLREWDVRSISKPVSENSIRLGGGVWRIKHHPVVPGLVLAACMHNGFAIVNIGGGNADLVETYCKHDSLAYGADWQRGSLHKKDGRERSLVATCSFYDRLLRIWMPEIGIGLGEAELSQCL
ncbi:hypothetical protein GIB67_005434 [Kingdonia uniflora]|uniref:methylated diphthine methylhydrolase n=1 Tax=Kingdonia uniflora TaxID=39325 RepID=A0A7J7NHX9_9MAGN|nr:hypothetical protein GIB67_005434 [Kingdonia uniflora]